MVEKKDLYLDILKLLNDGNNPSKISKILKLTKQNINYYIRQLKQDGKIKKVGYGTWEVKSFNPNTHRYLHRGVRGHAFIWTIKLNKKFDWGLLLKNKNYKPIRNNAIKRMFIKNKKVWFTRKSIVVFENKSFYGNNAIQSRKYAVSELLEVLKSIESRLRISLQPYTFKPSREHYGLIKNDLAIQCNKRGEKICIRDNLEGEWLWIDDSESLGELENGGKKALTRSVQVQKWWNDHKKNNFEVTPSFLKESISGMVQVQQMHSQNIVKHQKVLDDMLTTLKAIRDNLDGKEM